MKVANKSIVRVCVVALCVAIAFSTVGCTAKLNERIANLESQVARLGGLSAELSEERVAELEALIGELRAQIDGSNNEVIADVIAENIQSTVAIQIEAKRIFDTKYYTGSGFFVEYGGYVITNSHVVTPPSGYDVSKITVYHYNGTSSQATLVANLPDIDLAIVRSTFYDAKPVKLATQTPVQGARVIAIGSPSGLSLKFSATSGIVSALDRTEVASGEDGKSYHQFCIQHDAPINPGNSGGALFNLAGEVVGVNTMGLRTSSTGTVYEALAFATEVSAIIEIQKGIGRMLDEISSYQLPSLGVTVTDSILSTISDDDYKGNGVKVIQRTNNKFALGDIITVIDGKAIATRQDFYKAVLARDAGDTISVTLTRDYVKHTISVTV